LINKEDWLGRNVARRLEMKNAHKNIIGKSEGKGSPGNPDVCVMIILIGT
jgi:hypothetical protein